MNAREFINDDFRTARAAPKGAGLLVADAQRAASREEADSKVGQMRDKLAELKHAQEELECERSALAETRRRQAELATGREAMLHHLTRAIGLLEDDKLYDR